MGLQIVGETGVVGLSMFKLRWLIGGTRVLARPPGARAEVETDPKLDDDV